MGSAEKSQPRPTPTPCRLPTVLPSLQLVSQIYSSSHQEARRNPLWLRPFLAPPLQSQIEERPRPNLPSPAPDGVDVRVQLLHSRSQKLQEPLGEEVTACGPCHRGPCPGHSGGTSPGHHELP